METRFNHKRVSQEDFHAEIRRAERARNIGCITTYDATNNITKWYVFGYMGYSNAPIGAATEYYLAI